MIVIHTTSNHRPSTHLSIYACHFQSSNTAATCVHLGLPKLTCTLTEYVFAVPCDRLSRVRFANQQIILSVTGSGHLLALHPTYHLVSLPHTTVWLLRLCLYEISPPGFSNLGAHEHILARIVS